MCSQGSEGSETWAKVQKRSSAYVRTCRWHADVAFMISYNRRATASPKKQCTPGKDSLAKAQVSYHRVREHKEPKPSSEQEVRDGRIRGLDGGGCRLRTVGAPVGTWISVHEAASIWRGMGGPEWVLVLVRRWHSMRRQKDRAQHLPFPAWIQQMHL